VLVQCSFYNEKESINHLFCFLNLILLKPFGAMLVSFFYFKIGVDYMLVASKCLNKKKNLCC
jgi:hypothetical protein